MVTRLLPLLLLLLCVPGCSLLPGARAPRRLRLPSDMRPAPAASTATEAKKDAKPQPHAPRYVVRLAERGRVWELELPEGAGGYEVRVPLEDSALQPTVADAQLLAGERPTPPPGAPQVDAAAAAQERSYLGHLARVSEMYSQHRYELALVELVDLERLYPKDARLQAMKGSLYSKLQKPALAREAWQRALSLNPEDAVVAAALRELDEQRE
jgi:tetratricopeptide (TPR) repeat protein